MSEKKFSKKELKLILNALRQASVFWEGRTECLEKARRRIKEGFYKNGEPKYKYYWQCAQCKEWYREQTELEVDHIDPVGSFKGSFDDWIPRLFCGPENLQALCVSCHLAKTTSSAKALWKRKDLGS